MRAWKVGLRLGLGGAVALICLGCGSVGYQAPKTNPSGVSLAQVTEKFYIRNIDTSFSNLNMQGTLYQAEINQVLSAITVEMINQTLSAKYPLAFAETGAMPLDIAISLEYDNNYARRIGGAAVCGCTFGIIPFPMTSYYTFSIRMMEPKTVEHKLFQGNSQTVKVERRGWASILPTGYIPCPSETDTSKEPITGMIGVEMDVSEKGRGFIAEQVAAGVAAIVAQVNVEDLNRMAVLRGVLGE